MTPLSKYLFKMSTKNIVLASEITTTVTALENATYGLRNFKVNSSALVVRTMGNAQTVKITFDKIYAVDIFYISKTNLTVGSSIRIKGYLNSTLVYDSGVSVFLKNIALGDYGQYWGYIPLGGDTSAAASGVSDYTQILDAPITMDYCEIEVTAVNNTYIDISKVIVSTLYMPIAHNISYGLSMSFENNNSISRTASGGAFVTRKFSFRVITISFDNMNLDNRKLLHNVFAAYVGLPMFVTCYPNYETSLEKHYSGLFVITSKPSMSNTAHNRFSAGSITFEEV